MPKKAPQKTYLALTDTLPLQCTRSGTCCHGKMVWLNPWELACLASAKGLPARDFRDLYCEFGGIRLQFDKLPLFKGLSACSQYVPDLGCSVHDGRPLSCRLYPLGRERRGEKHSYMYQGQAFPCLEDCPQVVNNPHLQVQDYLAIQNVTDFEKAHEEYMGILEELADGAFVLLLETGLAATGDRQTLRLWRKLGAMTPEQLVHHLGPEWVDRVMLPAIAYTKIDPFVFAKSHFAQLQAHAQSSFGSLDTPDAIRAASGIMMGLALLLGLGLGANPVELSRRFIATAKEHGAGE